MILKTKCLIDIIKTKRKDLVKYTFSDLDSRGKNHFVKRIREQEKRLIREYYKLDNRLNKIDNML